MKYASVCSGIEAPTVAWHSMEWKPMWFCENAPFPSAVLKYHYPTVPNLGDLNFIHEKEEIHQPIDLIFGGTPCPSFSSAGNKQGLVDERGKLAIKFFKLVGQLRPRWMVWENVPGVFSRNKGRDFGRMLGTLAELGYSCAWRVLDAQYFGVPQRRRRIFIVGYLGTDWRRPAAVLFNPKGLSWNIEKSRKKRKEITGPLSARTKSGGFPGTDGALNGMIQPVAPSSIHPALLANISATIDVRPLIYDCNQITSPENRSNPKIGDATPCLTAKTSGDFIIGFNPDIALNPNDRSNLKSGDPSPPLLASCNNNTVAGNRAGGVRRVTPLECERLMGLPDNYTRIPWRGKAKENCPDSHRYRACGNSIVVPVLGWIGRKIQAVENIIQKQNQ